MTRLTLAHYRAIVELMYEAGEAATFAVEGDSMVPTLRAGDRVRIVPIEPGDLQPGLIVAYVDAGAGLIVHRVVRVEGQIVITRGDNRDHNDPPVTLDQVLGCVRMCTKAVP